MNNKLTQNLLITTIGPTASGKTTVMCLLAELLFADGFKIKALGPMTPLTSKVEITGTYCLSDVGMILAKPVEDSILLKDHIKDLEEYEQLKKIQTIIIRIRTNKWDSDGGRPKLLNENREVEWFDHVPADLTIVNEGDLRLLAFYTRQLYAQIQELPIWKQSIA
jgi:energy-coupling factor transporter ATP-binding protein EcfA2